MTGHLEELANRNPKIKRIKGENEEKMDVGKLSSALLFGLVPCVLLYF